MNLTRRNAIFGSAIAFASSLCNGQIVKSSSAVRSIFTGSSSNVQETLQNWINLFTDSTNGKFEDYSLEELHVPLFSNTNYLSPLDVTFYNLKTIAKPTCFVGSRLRSLTCPKLTTIIGQQQFQSSQKLVFVDFPELQYISNCQAMFGSCNQNLREVNLGKITAFNNPDSPFVGCVLLENVQIKSMLCETLLSYSTPFFRNCPHQIVFHCENGNVIYDEDTSAWIKTDIS